MADGEEQQQLLSNSSVPAVDVGNTDEIPAEQQPEEQTLAVIPQAFDWTTSRLSQICREGDVDGVRAFVEYSQQTKQCRERASNIADQLDPETGLSPLHHAARHQQLDICLILLSNIEFVRGVNIKDASEQTPIHAAFRSSNTSNPNKTPEKSLNIEKDFGNKFQEPDVWREDYTNAIIPSDHPLIYLFGKVGGDIDARDKYLLTPLHYAVARNNLAGVKQLIKLDADIESRDRQWIRPLHLACKEGYASIVEYLVEQDATVFAVDSDSWIPMHYACLKGHLNIMELIKRKETIRFEKFLRMKTNTDATCLHLAVQSGTLSLVEFILTEFSNDSLKVFINEQSEPLGTPMHIAAKFCDPAMTNLLYRHGGDPSILNAHDQSPLHIASVSNRIPIIRELHSLTDQALFEIKDDHGQTALSTTTHLPVIDELLSLGADISSIDNNHMNALMLAAASGRTSIVERLLLAANNEDLTILDQVDKKDGRSVFLIAAKTGNVDICAMLLSHPAIRWDVIDKQRMNVFHIAAKNNHHELIKLLGERIKTPARLVPIKSRTYSFSGRLVSRANTTDSETQRISSSSLRFIDAQDEDGATPLHMAACQGHSLCIQMLLNLGSDVLLTNFLGQLPLHTAIQNGHVQCVELLIKAGTRNLVDFQAAISRRQSPLISACQNGYADIVQLLLSQNIGVDYGMDDGTGNSIEENPLEVAIQYRQVEVVNVLLEHPHTEHWLMTIRSNDDFPHWTPLRSMIRTMPECALHAFDKLILKTQEIDVNGEPFERITYNYKYIDDYFTKNGDLYLSTGRQRYRNHPFIIALDAEHHSLLEHPLAQQLLARKWKLYRSLFYLARILPVLLLLILTLYVLVVPAPKIPLHSSTNKTTNYSLNQFVTIAILPMQWTIVILATFSLLKIFMEIIFYRGLRVPFAQLFAAISFFTAIVAFVPYQTNTELPMTSWQWQLAALTTLLEWLNVALILRSLPFIGNFIFMFQSILINFTKLTFVNLPLLIAFSIGTRMFFFDQAAFGTVPHAFRKTSAMLLGEFAYETLFFSKPTLSAAPLIFFPFVIIMTIVLMNLLLGFAVGDIKSSMAVAQGKANAYQIRELIYMEATLPSVTWLKAIMLEKEIVEYRANNSILTKKDKNKERDDDDDPEGSASVRQRTAELSKSLDILNMLCTQAKQVLEEEIDMERTLRDLLTAKLTHGSITSIPDS